MDSDVGKLFVGGISWETTEDRLKDYFSNYGEVTETLIMKDRATGRARGFGFVVFADPTIADRVLLEKHMIDGRTVEAKKAVPRDEQQNVHRSVGGGPAPAGVIRTKKIFVGGLASTINEEDFKKYFEQFGTITDVVVMYDHATQRPRGFGFITFDSEDAVDNVLQKSFHELNDKLVEVKRAIPKELQGPAWTRSPGASFGGAAPRGSPFGSGYSTSLGSYGGRYAPGPGGRGGYPTYGGSSYGAAGYATGGSYGSGMNGSYGGAVGYGSAGGSYSGGSYGGTPGGGYAAGYGTAASAGSGGYGSPSGRNAWGSAGYGNLGSSAGYGSGGGGGGYGSSGGWSSGSGGAGQAAGAAGGYGAAGYGYGGSDSGYGSAAGSYSGRVTGYGSGIGSYGGQSGATGSGSYGAGYGDGYAVSGYQDNTWRSGSAEPYGAAPGGSGSAAAAGYGGTVPVADTSGAGYGGGYGESSRQARGPDARFKSYPDHTGY